jgi:hypothetical protein
MAALAGLAALPFILALPGRGAQQPIITPTEKAEEGGVALPSRA